jgi:hypothetical protein
MRFLCFQQKRDLFALLFFILALMPSLSSAVSNDEVVVQHSNDPNQKTHAYAGKLFWNQRDRIWQRKIVVYRNLPEPAKDHPVWMYVKKLKIPQHAGTKDLYYKRFHATGNCTGKTPLAAGKPWTINFDRNTLGRYSETEFRRNWNCPQWGMGLNLLAVVGGAQAYHGKALRIHYPKGVAGCPNSKQCVNWKPKLDNQFTKLYYGYRFKFPRGFQFVKGGKLPGIGGGKSNTNGRIPNGKDGWSVRMMWEKDGTLIQYVYHPDQPSKFGDIMHFDMQPLTLGQWHTVQTMVQLNQAGKKDGAILTWLDGKLVFKRYKMRFRTGSDLKIDRFLFATFYGGTGSEWAPRRDNYAFIDDVKISPYPVFYKK